MTKALVYLRDLNDYLKNSEPMCCMKRQIKRQPTYMSPSHITSKLTKFDNFFIQATTHYKNYQDIPEDNEENSSDLEDDPESQFRFPSHVMPHSDSGSIVESSEQLSVNNQMQADNQDAPAQETSDLILPDPEIQQPKTVRIITTSQSLTNSKQMTPEKVTEEIKEETKVAEGPIGGEGFDLIGNAAD